MRVTPGKDERVRIYHENGPEIPPAEIGDFRSKEPEAMDEQWSIEEQGVCILYYFKVDISVQGIESAREDQQLDASEYSGRDWVIQDKLKERL